MRRLGAVELLELTLDDESFVRWDFPAVHVAASEEYKSQLARARTRTGLDEAVIIGEGRIRGRRVAVVAVEFGFLAGSVGVAAAEHLVSSIRRATAEQLPLLAAPVSAGTRLHEGTIAFLQMVKISIAISDHKAAGLPYLVYLRDPTLGGVLASWASLGHVTVAEPGALVGFLGPRVYEALRGAPLPPGVQTAENLYSHGLVDAVLPPEEIAVIADRALTVLESAHYGPPDMPEEPADPDVNDLPDTAAWESITRSRRDERPSVRRLLRQAATDVVPLNGTGEGETDLGLLLALARIGGTPCVLIGHDRSAQTLDAPLGPAALRKARRGMRLARELRLPLITMIDTPGAALSIEAEEGGLAGEIARTLTELVTLQAPTLSVLFGQGTGGGALALLPADRVVAAQHAWLAPMPPEGASFVMYQDTGRAAEIAEKQGVRSRDLLQAGIVDRVVPEFPDAADEPNAFCDRLSHVLAQELAQLIRADPGERHAARLARYARLGR